ncbi:MAG TPA: homocysteine S-methyltransferase family protein [Candidatus Kapabacteria bacterium]|nr:homocysteine S-methyltransferase family protein [Candidatus Kapabacteria bacterium]
MSSFLKALQHGALLLDGALGTELERRGVDTSRSGWTSHAIVENPDTILQVHREYIHAGARIVTANSFRTNPRAHKKTGLSAEELTKRSVELAREAASGDPEIYVAGSIAPAIDSLPPQSVVLNDQELLQEHSLMAKWLAEANVDVIFIETMNTVREAFIALVAAKRNTSLPIAVSLVPASGKHLLSGASLAESVDLLAKAGADVLLLNCQSLSIVTPALREFAALCAGAGIKWGVYPNAAERVNSAWVLRAHEDHEFAAFAELARDNDAAIIGSCCGTTPSTTEVMSTVLQSMR